MKDLRNMDYFPQAEKLVDILCNKTRNKNRHFFRVMIAYNFCKLASMMRTSIHTPERGKVPINMYAINLAPSGFGKGHSTSIMEEQLLHKFMYEFNNYTLPAISEENLEKLAMDRANLKGTDASIERLLVNKEYDSSGELVSSFDSGTSPAVKQLRHKILMAKVGSLNFEMDEVGSNILANTEVLTTFLELFDKGNIKQKLTKNTSENKRVKEIDGRTPTNMLLYGTPAKLLNGGKEESEYDSMLQSGYARRCFFSFVTSADKMQELSPQEIFDLMTNTDTDDYLEDFSDHLQGLADGINYDISLDLPKELSLILIEYQLHCEKLAAALPEHEETKKSELAHRYFKALKLAGAYAFISQSPEIQEEHLYAAIRLAEDSGDAFGKVSTREKSHVKLAKYLATANRDVTNVDLMDDLPFFRGTASSKAEMLTLARAWGYRNNVIVKTKYEDGIEFFSGESIEETDLSKLIVSHSSDWSKGYSNDLAAFDSISKLTQIPNYYYVNHHLMGGDAGDGHRDDKHCIPGFNTIVIDVDGTCPIVVVKELLSDYAYHLYLTKSHTDEEERFRLVIPISHTLKLDTDEYREFMGTIYNWLPFEVDEAAKDRSRRWSTHSREFYTNEGQLLDILPFIPKTSKNEDYRAKVANLGDLSNIERWFVSSTAQGNRSSQLIKYALCLVDAGMDVSTISAKVLSLNEKLQDKLPDDEVHATILKTVANRLSKK